MAFDFQGNSSDLFDALSKGAPLPMRGMIKKALTKALAEVAGGDDAAVAPQQVIDAVKKSTPKPFVGNALKSAAGMHTCAATCDGCNSGCPLSP